ncbi:SOR/SNZ family-domain-containing protein [Biscogniauxia mediterranea]|nr:SOR/SNZ family-domain-containing protein [Biscogniauxia mediterranea]
MTNDASNAAAAAAPANGTAAASNTPSFTVKAGLAQMLKGGVIMDVTDAAQARIAEDAGACAVMALERVPADIRAEGGVARMSDPGKIKEIQEAVTIPVMAKARIGHFVECQILEALGVDYIDESEVLTPADDAYHVEKAVKHMRTVNADIARAKAALQEGGDLAIRALAREFGVDAALLKQTAELGRLPVVNFAAGGVATPADAALMMQLGCDGVFVGSGIFKSGDAAKRAKAIVRATTHFRDAKVLAECSEGLGEAMVGISVSSMKPEQKLAGRGW